MKIKHTLNRTVTEQYRYTCKFSLRDNGDGNTGTARNDKIPEIGRQHTSPWSLPEGNIHHHGHYRSAYNLYRYTHSSPSLPRF